MFLEINCCQQTHVSRRRRSDHVERADDEKRVANLGLNMKPINKYSRLDSCLVQAHVRTNVYTHKCTYSSWQQP